MTKPRLSALRVLEMNLGFLGLQFSFGLQQANMSPIYTFLGADPERLPLLWLAGPMTGLIVQPLIGAVSDRTLSRLGRRTPYFLVGAVICSICLAVMPFSSSVLMAASVLWLLDAGNNVTQEPYRAYVNDRLAQDQRALGFLSQAAFTGLAQTGAYLAPSILLYLGLGAGVDVNGIPKAVRIAFLGGAVISLVTILWSVVRVRELPLTPEERAGIVREIARKRNPLVEIWEAIVTMPPTMRQLALPMFCQWYAMFCYWQYISLALRRSLFGAALDSAAAFRDAALVAGRIGAAYNFVAFVGAFALVPIVRRLGGTKVHAACLSVSGAAMLVIPGIAQEDALYVPMVGIGFGWASMMGTTYAMLAATIPAARAGIYMGIFNMFIVVPMLIQTATMPFLFGTLLGGDPRHVLWLAGGLMGVGALATLLVGGARTRSAAVLGSR